MKYLYILWLVIIKSKWNKTSLYVAVKNIYKWEGILKCLQFLKLQEQCELYIICGSCDRSFRTLTRMLATLNTLNKITVNNQERAQAPGSHLFELHMRDNIFIFIISTCQCRYRPKYLNFLFIYIFVVGCHFQNLPWKPGPIK